MQSITMGHMIGRYKIVEKLGEGGMAVVYKAIDTRLERYVAIKVVTPAQQHSEQFLKRFEREAKALARLTQPNTVHVNDYGEHEEMPYLVMDYIPGGTLKQRMGRRYPWPDAFSLIMPVARALEHAHKNNIVHRDVKPTNILLTENGEPMLSDFGIAKVLESENTSDLTATGMGVGTPEYMAPEQGMGMADTRADIYALGVVLYELITGRKPFEADTPMAVMLKKATEPLPRPTLYVPDLPTAVEYILAKSLEKDPNRRYQTMAQLINDMQSLLNNPQPARATTQVILPPQQPEPEKKTSFLKIALILAAAFVCLCITSGGIYVAAQVLKPATETVGVLPPAITNESPGAAYTAAAQTLEAELTKAFRDIQQTTDTAPTSTGTPVPPTETPTPNVLASGRVAFASDMYGNNEIILLDLATGKTTRLTESINDDRVPAWSPDGKLIAYQSNASNNSDIYTVDPNTGAKKQLTSEDCSEWGPAWSPDGKRITYYSNCDGNREIYTMRADGGNKTQLTFTQDTYNWFPSYSPDGKMITFSSNRVGGKYHIFVMGTTGENLTDLGTGCISSFSPDGSQIVFSQYCTDLGDIFIMNADGSDRRQLTGSNNCRNPAFSPDGAKIIFQCGADNGNDDIWVMNIDGSDAKVLYSNPAHEGNPSWQP